MYRIEERITDKIVNNIYIILFILIATLGLILRFTGRDFISGDMKNY